MTKPAKKDKKPEEKKPEQEQSKGKPGYKKYSKAVKDKVIELHKTGLKPKEIVEEMGGNPKVKCVRRWIYKSER
jgi:hypothetical protein